MILREATDAELSAILDLCRQALGEVEGIRTETYWQWKHQQNPFGLSPVWVAETEGKLIGVRAFMRWRFRYNGEILQAYRAVDTATRPDYQGKGIFKKLTLTVVDQLQSEAPAFIFNTPNLKSMPGYLKMGWKVVGKTPLRVKLFPLNVMRGLRSASPDVEPLSLPDDMEVILNAWMQRHRGVVLTDYSVDYLTWRYEQVPGLTYGLEVARVNKSASVVIYRMKKTKGLRELRIAEIFYTGDDARAAVREALRVVAVKHRPDVMTIVADGAGALAKLLPAGFWKADRFGLTLTGRSVQAASSLEGVELESLLHNQQVWHWSAGGVELF